MLGHLQNEAWDVPRGTRTYLLQQVLDPGVTSARVDILVRFGRTSPCHEVALMANLAGRDMRSTTGRNMALFGTLSGLDS